jgi:hypothetical protein
VASIVPHDQKYRRFYFLYAWAEKDNLKRQLLWRYRLEDPTLKHQHLFSNLRALMKFLSSQERGPS